MKRILFVAFTATLLAASCQKTEIINQVPGEALTFTTAMSKLTKSVGESDADESDGLINLQAQDFKVWAYYTYADDINNVTVGAPYDEMEHLDVTYKESGWTTQLDYYWPGTNKSLDFFAVSTGQTWAKPEETEDGNVVTPAVSGVSVDIEGQGGTIGGRKLTVNGYSVDNADPNDDLMVAEFVRQHQDMNGKKVSVHFKHALAKVQFRFTTNSGSDKIEVKSLIVKDLKTTGTLTVEENGSLVESNGRVPVKLTWTGHDTPADFTDDYEGNLELKAPVTEGETVTKNDQEFATWLVLPQTIDEKTVTIEYDITSATGVRSFQQTFALTRPAVQEVKEGESVLTPGKEAFAEWKINQVVIYTINLSPNKITFDPSVETWDGSTNLTDQN
ncbi:MAG: fimbrillin family protein [Bacteroidales bacterium]|nr:fimbrillin family protein [Bacteroidales bacterium]